MNRPCPAYYCDYDGNWDWDDVLLRTKCPKCGTSISKMELLCGKPGPIDCYQKAPALSRNQTLGFPGFDTAGSMFWYEIFIGQTNSRQMHEAARKVVEILENALA